MQNPARAGFLFAAKVADATVTRIQYVMAAMITRVVGLGDARIITPSTVITPTAEMVFAAGLYLGIERGREIRRESIASLLWPAAEPTLRNHRLRQTILKLRGLQFPVASESGRSLRVERDAAIVDAEGAIDSAKARDTGAVFLTGYHPTFSPQYSEWLDAVRTRVHGSIARQLVVCIGNSRLTGDWNAVESYAKRLLEISPLNEEGTLALAEAMAMRGDKASAFALLDEFEATVGGTPAVRAQARTMRRRMSAHVSAPSRTALRKPLIGRQSVMRELTGQLNAVKEAKGHACLLLGTAGIGKSRVLSELHEFGMLEGVACIQVQCREGHQQAPLAAFIQMVPDLRALPGSLGCSPDTISFLDRLTRHDPQQRDAFPPSTDSAWIFFNVRRALFDLLDAVAEEQPILVEIEDVQWLDNASASLMRDMIGWAKTKRIMFALTGRELPADWHHVRPAGLDVFSLAPLSPDDSALLIETLVELQRSTIDRRYADWCVEVAEGNPYFITELINYWIETGLEHQVPSSLAEVLGERIARLRPEALEVLQTVALLENDSTLQRIEAVLQYDAHELLRSIDELGRADMITVRSREAGAPSDLISSKHDLLSAVALQQLSEPAKIFLHRRIGQILDAEISERFLAATVWSSAKHWQLAGDLARAWHLAKECGTYLTKVGLFSEAAAAFEKAIAFARSDEQKLQVYEGQISSFFQMSAWTNVREISDLLHSTRCRLQIPSPTHDELELMSLRAEWQELQWASVFQKSMQCLNAVEASVVHRAEAGVMAMMLASLTENSHLSAIYSTLEPLLNDAAVPNSTKFLGRMVFHTSAGDLRQAQTAAVQLIEHERENRDIGGLLRAYGNASVTYRVAGRFSEAQSCLREALKLADCHGLESVKLRLLPVLGNLALEIGDLETARETEAKLSVLKVDAANRFNTVALRTLRTRLALAEGRTVDARNNVPGSLEAALSDTVPHQRTYSIALHVAVMLAEHKPISKGLLDAFAKSFDQSKRSLHQAFAVCVLSAAYATAGRTEQAKRVMQDYEAVRRELWPIPEHLRVWSAHRVSPSEKRR